MYIVIGILVFGILIVVHELGHFAAAKAFGVRVLEFSIGMGPRIFKKQGGETLYSLRALPLGGSCLMEGEDEDLPDPRSFTAQSRWKRLIILVAGAFMNFLMGAVIVFVLVAQMQGFAGTTVKELVDGFPTENGIRVGDTITEINGEKLYYINDFSMFMSMSGGKPVDLVVKRDGVDVALNDIPLAPREYTINGEKQFRYGITFNQIEGTTGEKLKYSVYTTANYVRLVRVSLVQLFSGSYGLRDLSGPVGIVSIINQVGQSEGATTGEKIASVANFAALIAINLAVMNLLPIPALDGGRIFFMIVTYFIEKISRKRVDPKYEGYIHTAGFVLLLGLMCVVMVNDVVKLVNG